MADVYAVFGTLLALGIAFPGMLTATWLLFPNRVARAGEQQSDKPGRTFFIGLAGVFTTAIPITLLFVIGAPFTSVLGAFGLILLLAFAAIGAAGLTLKMSHRLEAKIESGKPMRNYLAAAIALEMAAIFPFIGWFVIIPGALILSFGAVIASLFTRRQPTRRQPEEDSVRSEAMPSAPVEV